MDNGGFSEFAAVLGGIAAVAAVMSTIDSAVLALTNIFTQDFLRNWVFAAGASFSTEIQITIPPFGCLLAHLIYTPFTCVGHSRTCWPLTCPTCWPLTCRRAMQHQVANFFDCPCVLDNTISDSQC
jgi:hypothetical protein